MLRYSDSSFAKSLKNLRFAKSPQSFKLDAYKVWILDWAGNSILRIALSISNNAGVVASFRRVARSWLPSFQSRPTRHLKAGVC
jgi:hypothetical protein